MLTDKSVRSRIIDSTSRPTYPTSVYFEASTLMNGASTNLANRRATSVLPTPVEPTMIIFLGATSSRISSGNIWRRDRFRSAIATDRLASPWPMIYRSSSSTICLGVSEFFKDSRSILSSLALISFISTFIRLC